MKNAVNILVIFFVTFSVAGCENHIDKYKVNIDSLKTLPDGFYAYRRGNVFVEDIKTGHYRTWYNLTESGDIQDITRMDDFKNFNNNTGNNKAFVINN